jgi:hypothetical protein
MNYQVTIISSKVVILPAVSFTIKRCLYFLSRCWRPRQHHLCYYNCKRGRMQWLKGLIPYRRVQPSGRNKKKRPIKVAFFIIKNFVKV